MLSFDHELTEIEVKLKYLNLKDLAGKQYGSLFPPVRSQILVFDDEDRKYNMVKAGINQITGDFYFLISKNEYKPGDILTIEYDREESTDEYRDILHIRLKKSK